MKKVQQHRQYYLHIDKFQYLYNHDNDCKHDFHIKLDRFRKRTLTESAQLDLSQM